MKMSDDEVRFKLTLTWAAMPPSDDPTEDNPHHNRDNFIAELWREHYLDDEKWGDEGTFDAEKKVNDDGSVEVVLKSDMPEAMAEVMWKFAMEMSYHFTLGTGCKFEKVRH